MLTEVPWWRSPKWDVLSAREPAAVRPHPSVLYRLQGNEALREVLVKPHKRHAFPLLTGAQEGRLAHWL